MTVLDEVVTEPKLRIVREQDPFETAGRVLTAAGFPAQPPAAWFEDPRLDRPTPLHVEDSGRVFGHIATWNTRHIGMHASVAPPKSRANYGYFRTGSLRTAEGTDVNVGQLTLAGGHAPLRADAASAVRHYDDTASAVADLAAGEDSHGIWVAGALRSSASSDQIRALRASAPSGDWRPINGNLELVAVCQVNVPGFPVARGLAAGGELLALVAAGAQDMLMRKFREADRETLDRLDTLESMVASMQADQQRAQLRSQVHGTVAAFGGDWSPPARKKAASKGQAMKNEDSGGSFPIKDEADLKRAIKAYGRAKDKDKAKKHIMSRAKSLGKMDLIPDSWK